MLLSTMPMPVLAVATLNYDMAILIKTKLSFLGMNMQLSHSLRWEG